MQNDLRNDQTFNEMKQLSSLSFVLSSLPLSKKSLLAWGVIHLSLGIALWVKGQWTNNGLALTGFSYLVIFDAMGVFTTFISSVLKAYESLRLSSIRNPFGIQRFEVLFGFVNTLYLLFVALYMLKEGLEHFVLESNCEHSNIHSHKIPILWVLLAMCATLISAIGCQNHKGFYALSRPISFNEGSHTYYLQSNYRLSIIYTNFITMALLLCGTGVITVGLLLEKSRNFGWLDELMSILESILMFYIAVPVASALGKILLQTTPSTASKSLDDCLREILLHPTILSLNATHFWQNSYGQLVGTLHVHVNPDVNEQAVLAFVYSRLSPLFLNSNGNGELTVQIVK
ncbi:cation efflux family-domain-containing protein [Gigaspora rosea]|uniref:Cation efflux family-domain-containing protein n=1 Tax=Gigaspora rosea TaxID=44941 RepID=A0A397VRE6_9GLOM|nr:cation efflux family-domain-containing protein [Gigaspora rosea]